MKKQLLFEFKKFLLQKITFRITALAIFIFLTVQSSFAQQWNVLANEGQISTVASAYTTITVVADTPYVSYIEGTTSGVGKVKKLNTSTNTWDQVGGNIGTNISYSKIYSDKTGKLYVTYLDNASSTKLAVVTYNETSSAWETVGGTGVYVSVGSATHTSAISYIRSDLTFDSNNIPYITYAERVTNSGAYVKRFNGSSWEAVGSPTGLVSADALTTGNAIALDAANIPYIVYIKQAAAADTTGTLFAYRINSTTGLWELLTIPAPVTGGSTAATITTGARHSTITMDSDNNPIILFGNSNANKATAFRYTKSSGLWDFIGNTGTRDASRTTLINDTAGNLYDIFHDALQNGGKSNTIRVYKRPAGTTSTFSELTNTPTTSPSGVGIDAAGANSNTLNGTIIISGSAVTVGVSNVAIAIGSNTTKPYIVYTKTNSNNIVTPTVRVFDTTTKPIPTWNGTEWSNTSTLSTEYYDAIITGPYSTLTNGAFPFKIATLTVNTGGTLTVNTGTSVTILNGVVNNAGVNGIVIENNANLIQVNSPSNVGTAFSTNNTGNVVINRNSNSLSRLDYTMWSSPVSIQKLADFSPLTSQSPSRFYTYNATTNLYVANTTPTTSTFTAGTGYLIRMPNTAVESPSTETFAGQFTGVPNNGHVGLTVTANLFYAVGNPYPSTISADLFLSGNTTTGTLYFWRKTNAAVGTAYATYTALGGAGTAAGIGGITPNGTIQVGQGFIVKPTVTTLNFTNVMRTANNSNQIFKTKAVEKNRIWLNLTNPTGVFSQALVGYIDGATQGVDEGIDGAYINDSPVALTSNINGEEYTIQGRPAFDTSDVVALNFKTDVAGDYTIAIDHTDGLFATGQDVYLVDSTTETETNLKTDAYTFTATTGTAASRFSLKYQKNLGVDAPAFNENNVAVYKNNGTLYVNSGANAISNIKVFDIQGRLIAEQKNVNATSTSIKNLKANQQVLIVKVTSQDNKVVNKKVVN